MKRLDCSGPSRSGIWEVITLMKREEKQRMEGNDMSFVGNTGDERVSGRKERATMRKVGAGNIKDCANPL